MGVRVNVVARAFVRTDASAHMPQVLQQQLADRAPLRPVAEADDVARAITILVGEDDRFVTGAVGAGRRRGDRVPHVAGQHLWR